MLVCTCNILTAIDVGISLRKKDRRENSSTPIMNELGASKEQMWKKEVKLGLLLQ